MAILQMQRINIYALSRYCKDILETLQRMGVMQVEQLDMSDSVFYKEDPSQYSASYRRNANVTKQAYEIIGEYVKEKKSLLSSLEGRKPLSKDEYDTFVDNTPEVMRIAYGIINCKKKIAENRARIVTYQSRIETLSAWESLDIPLSSAGSKTTATVFGSFAQRLDYESLRLMIAEDNPELSLFDFEIISADDNQTCVFFICIKDRLDELMQCLRRLGVILPAVSTKSSPVSTIEMYNQRIEKRQSLIDEYIAKIVSYQGAVNALRFFEDYFTMKAERYQQIGNLSYSPHTFVMTGYIPARDAGQLSTLLFERYEAEVELEDINNEDTPVLLHNNGFSQPVEGVLLSYSPPSRTEIDPTAVMAIFYYIFFGMMFSDAGYGLVMSLGCALAILKFKNMESGLKRSLKMFFFCGISTMFWGLMFGSFFGDAVAVICKTFFGMQTPPSIPGITTPIWFNPTTGTGPTQLLMFAFLLGLIHLFTGLILQAVNYIRNGKLLYAIFDDLSWILLVSGAVIALLSTDMLKGMSSFTLPADCLIIGGIIAGVGALIILFFSARNKNPIKRFVKGLYNLYGATGYLSDVLSYSRLLALGLATGVVAQVFNQLGSMLGGGVAGAIVFTLVFIVGHLLNIGINALGAYVHTNRLQFVEFFGKFYDGGGREFTPYAVNTKYYNIKEDI